MTSNSNKDSCDAINREAEQAAARGSRMLFYPYLNGPSVPDYYQDAEGCFYGASLSSTCGDFALAVMRGVAFQIRIMLEAMGAYPEVTQLVLFGGGARSPLWCQCIVDAAGVRVHVPSFSEAASRGAEVLAGTAAGAWTKESFPKDTAGMCISHQPPCRPATDGIGKSNGGSGQRRQYAVHRKRKTCTGAWRCLGQRAWNREWPDRLVRTSAKLRNSTAGGAYRRAGALCWARLRGYPCIWTRCLFL